MKTETCELTFKIHGSYITDLARQKLNDEQNLPAALQLLMNCLMTDQLTNEKRLIIALQILNKKAYIKGIYPEESYGVVIEDDSKTTLEQELAIALTPLTNQIKTIKKEHETLQQKYLFLLDYLELSDYKKRKIDEAYFDEYEEHIFENEDEPVIPPILQSFMERQHTDTDDDYGWLEPDGTYHPVNWGDHADWAVKYLDKHYPFATHAHMYWTTTEKETRRHIVGGDVLVYKLHWVLLHNPSQGIAMPTYDHTAGLTKKQKEFLFDYYTKRNKPKMANALYQEKD